VPAGTRYGAAVDPTSATVEVAFPAPTVEPTSWNAASWETAGSRYHARCLVGPGGTVQLADGTYDMWVRITGLDPELIVRKAPGQLTIT
jgi:hypothetical protein